MKATVLVLLSALPLLAQEETVTAEMQGHVTKPKAVEATSERLKGLTVPEGFEISTFAKGLDAPRMMAFGPDGSLYVTKRGKSGEVRRLKDADGDGRAETNEVVAEIPHVHGIAIRGKTAYLAAIRNLYSVPIRADGTFGEPKVLYGDLPDAGQHPNRTLEFSPDGELFLSVGSTCNAALEPNPESATLLRVKVDGSAREIFATGLRNTIGFDWHPETKELWGMDHGIDWLGDDENREELNKLTKGAQYGWPFVYEDGKRNPSDNPMDATGLTWEEYAAKSTSPVLTYQAHAAPLDMIFYTGQQFPEKFRGDAFVTMRGSWNRKKPVGYELVRVVFDDGRPTRFEPFVHGFLLPEEVVQFGRPCGLALAPDGSLFLSDDSGGAIYRITYSGE
ncbi:MAG: PQQ-dependent sugar dehydrogenase [Terrimicrobiaceae bacterium]|nr:PQQ-dependent sugar dehydrogenase [Terrimicrobiaceae bacterium]